VECERAPMRWRTAAPVAAYSYLRDAELGVLLVQDVDLEHDQIHVTKAWNRRTGAIGWPKGGKAREVPIEPALKPPLRALVKGQPGGGRQLELPSERDMARGLQQQLLRNAGVDRPGRFDRQFSTTERYLDLAGTKQKGLGAVFPALPKPLAFRNIPSSHPPARGGKVRD
jgi:integrase